jgi:hypothetical protein
VTMGMAGFAFRGGAENGGDVIMAFDVGLLCELEVAAIGLAFAGESLFQIFPGLGVLESGHGPSLQ